MLTEEPPTSAAVATRLLPFWPANSRVWFLQVEAQFARRGITTSRTKYEEVVCALPTKYATEVEDLLAEPPEQNPYEKLKEHFHIFSQLTVDWSSWNYSSNSTISSSKGSTGMAFSNSLSSALERSLKIWQPVNYKKGPYSEALIYTRTRSDSHLGAALNFSWPHEFSLENTRGFFNSAREPVTILVSKHISYA